MTKSKLRLSGFLAIIAILGFSIAPASATLFIEELFDGIANTSAPNSNTDGNVNGSGDSNASLGFLTGSTWLANAGSMRTANNFDVGITYPDVSTFPGTEVLPGLTAAATSKGGVWNGSGSYATTIYATRELASSVDFSLDQTIYFSVRLDNSGDTALGVGLANGANGSASFVGAGLTWNNAIPLSGGGNIAGNSDYVAYGTLDADSGVYGIREFGDQGLVNGITLLVGRITISSTGFDSIQIKRYVSGDTIDNDLSTITWSTQSIFDASGDYDHLLLWTNGNNGSNAGNLDAIRFGTEWVDVTGVTAVPEPSSVAILMAGGLGLLAAARMRRRV